MSNPLSSVDCIGPAFSQTKRQLFSPFRLGRWLRLAVVCLTTGEFAGGGAGYSGGNFNVPQTHPRHGRTALLAIPNVPWAEIKPWIPWILCGVALIFVLFLLWIYVASVYRFVLFDSVLYDRCKLRGSWGRWEPAGRSYFYWCLAAFIGFLAGYTLILGVPLLIAWRIGWFQHPGLHVPEFVLGGMAIFFALFAFFVLGAIAALFAKDFCIPIMAMENIGVLDAWRRLLPMLAAEKLAFCGYVLMKIVLAVGSAIIFGITTILVLIIVFIPLGITGAIVFFAAKALGLGFSFAMIGILFVVGVLVVSGIIYLVGLVSTPSMVFFQSYALYFMGSRYPALGAVLFPPPPETQLPPPGEAPPPLQSPGWAPTG